MQDSLRTMSVDSVAAEQQRFMVWLKENPCLTNNFVCIPLPNFGKMPPRLQLEEMST